MRNVDGTPSTARSLRDKSVACCALCIALVLASCQTEPTQNRPRPLSAPFRSAERIFEQFLSPTAIAHDLDQMRDRASQMAADEVEVRDARKTAAAIGSREVARPRAMVEGIEELASDEQNRLAAVPQSKGWEALDPTADLSDLRKAFIRLPRTLSLDRRPLGEPDDVQHRTDPWDNHPEAGWSSRILRRILP